jgi:hypothetical protein
MKFDWYQASIPEVSPQLVMDTLTKSDYYGEWVETKPIKGYDIAAQFVLGDTVKYRINHGGQNLEHGPNVLATGSAAPMLAEVIRSNFPSHKVSRVDSCEDYHHQDAYDYLRKRALKIARESKVKVFEIVKPLPECDDGRSLYLGADSSMVSMRIYEKGKQLDAGKEWVRAELQVRPKKEVKLFASALSPLEMWGLAKWSHAMAQKMGNSDLQRVELQVYQSSDHERAYRFMLKQYRRVLEAMQATHGSWETVGAQIGMDLIQIHNDAEKTAVKLGK